MKNGFGMLMAIFFILLVSGIGIFGLSLASTGAKNSADSYLKEQAQILAQGATEYAMLRLLKHDFNSGCLNFINTAFTPPNETKKMFDINIKFKFFGHIGKCIGAKLHTEQSFGSVLVDVEVIYSKSEDDMQIYPIRFFKRTLQKL